MIDWNDKAWINYVDGKVWENLPDSTLKTRNSSEINFRCPICGDSRKSRTKKRGYFYLKTGTFYCFNCGTSLTGYAFLRAICPQDLFDRIIHDYRVLHFSEVVNGRGGEACLDDEEACGFEVLSPSPSYRYLLEMGWRIGQLSSSASSYLDERRIPPDGRDMLKSIWDSDGREFVLVQYVWDDRCIYHQLANFNGYSISGQGPVKYVFPKEESINGQPKPVFNLSSVSISFPYIICVEGVFDSLFVKNGVALGGRVLTSYQERMLSYCFPHHKVVLAFDSDGPGAQSMLKHAERHPDMLFLDSHRLLEAAGSKDINDFVRATGRTDVFSDEIILKRMMMSAFQTKMRLKLS